MNEFKLTKLPELKATDLRIGNWYQWLHEEDISYHQADVDFIKNQFEYNKDPDAEEFCRGWWACPIELNSEWLAIFGFDHDSYSNFSKKIGDYCYIVISFKDYACAEIRESIRIADHDVDAPCRYVHQLQNLYYAITGKELTACLEFIQVWGKGEKG